MVLLKAEIEIRQEKRIAGKKDLQPKNGTWEVQRPEKRWRQE